jgi:hypothetical protein
MREFTKSLFSYSLAASLFSLQQLQNLAASKREEEREGAATKAFRSATKATIDQFGGTLTSAFQALDNVQRGLVSLGFSFLDPRDGSLRSRGREL